MSTEEFIKWNNGKLNYILNNKSFEKKLKRSQERNSVNFDNDIYDIRNVRGHYEVFKNGIFYCSADTYGEAVKEIPS